MKGTCANHRNFGGSVVKVTVNASEYVSVENCYLKTSQAKPYEMQVLQMRKLSVASSRVSMTSSCNCSAGTVTNRIIFVIKPNLDTCNKERTAFHSILFYCNKPIHGLRFHEILDKIQLIEAQRQTDRQTDIDRQTQTNRHRQADSRQAGIQTGRQTHRQTGRQT